MGKSVVVIGLKTLFGVLGSLSFATVIYTIFVDGLPFRKDLLTPWMAATLVDFYINVFALAVWVSYKEASWLRAIFWVVLLICLGSIATSAYILLQLFNLSPQESSQDPMYHILLRRCDKDGAEQRRKHSSVVYARLIFGLLGCLMFGTLLYTLLTDGSPFRKELLTPWMTATLIDFYVNVVGLSVFMGRELYSQIFWGFILSLWKFWEWGVVSQLVGCLVWVAYKETSWLSALLWIILLIGFGSITTCVYIVQQLLQLTSQDPLYLVLINSSNRAGSSYERTFC